jgi:hypothetical protein
LGVSVVVAGCLGGDGEPLRTLSRVDVMNLPAGTATGTAYSGNYAIDTAFVSGCHCRLGLCSYFHVGSDLAFQVLQEEGKLSELDPAGLATGGIDADGTYVVGAAVEDGYGVSYSITNGEIHLVDGVPRKGGATVVSTVTGHFGMNLDCDLSVRETFHYDRPL